MASEHRSVERVGYVIITALAFCVGLLMGGQTCAPDPKDQEEHVVPYKDRVAQRASSVACSDRVVEKIVDRVIYKCPPEPQVPASKKRGPRASKTLPRIEPKMDPLERKRLLSWVREQSDDLKPCRDNRKDIYRVTVTLHMHDDTREIHRVDVNADRGRTPAGFTECLRQRILRWKPPKALVKSRSKIVFGLNI